jgi:hypothetical protein
VQVSLPAIIAPPSPTPIVVPVSIADTTGVLGVAVSFTYSPAVVTATQVTGAALAAGCTIVPSIGTPGMVVITAACPSGLPNGGSGPLFNVTFTAVANGHSGLAFTMTDEVPNGCLLNEGAPACQPQNGSIDIGPVVATPTATNTTVAVATPTATNTTVPVATATNTSPGNTATASATRTATSTATSAVATTTASATGTITFTNTAGPSPTPSQTRTTTATTTPSQTGTTTNTPANTNTPTQTRPASQTPTASQTSTQTQTFTVTPTGTITNTPPPTTTRAAIPVVPSPASPAGVLMIIGLGAGLVVALRRAAKH